MNRYDTFLTALNMAVNSYCSARFELPQSKRDRFILDHVKRIRDAADKVIAVAEGRCNRD